MAKCSNCRSNYTKTTSFQTWCSVDCAIKIANKKKEKQITESRRAVRRADKKKKDELKSKSKWAKEAQDAVNLYIRLRDKGRPCISCDKPDNGSHQRHASHYRSVGACSKLRFNTWNIHASCATCNSTLSGNLVEYRIRLKDKIGSRRVKWLEEQNGLTRYDIDYLKRLKAVFNRRARRLKVRYNYM